MEQHKDGSKDKENCPITTERDVSTGFTDTIDETFPIPVASEWRKQSLAIGAGSDELPGQSLMHPMGLIPYVDSLWTETQMQANRMNTSLHERSSGAMPVMRDRVGSFTQSIQSSRDVQDALLQFSSCQGTGQGAGVQQWRQCGEPEGSALTRPRNLMSIDTQVSERRNCPHGIIEAAGSSGEHAGFGFESFPPAEKRLRSTMLQGGTHELQIPVAGYLKHDNEQVHALKDALFFDSQQPSVQSAGTFFAHAEALERFELSGAAATAPGNRNPFPASVERNQWMSTEEAVRPLQALGVRGWGNLEGTRELNTMEQLLVHCASALEANDITYVQQIIWVMNNIASLDGDPNQKLLSYFLRALILRASKYTPHIQLPGLQGPLQSRKLMTALELTNYVDVMPWYRFGYIAANGAILEASEGKDKVHILDLNTSHCMQWPTLIEALAERSEGPPHVRLSVVTAKSLIPPQLEVSYDELIVRLAKFARLKHVPFEYQLLPPDCEKLEPSMIDLREGEVFVVNCLLRLHYVTEEASESAVCPRDECLRMIRSLKPAIVTLTDEDATLTSSKLVSRLKAAFNYLWIPFDALHTLLPKESEQRAHYEVEVASRIENIIACEGRQRIERVESKDRWVQRMKRARFEMVSFNEDVMTEIKHMLGEHSGCWGLKKDEDEDVLFLTWKGHNVSFSTVWVPVDLTAR